MPKAPTSPPVSAASGAGPYGGHPNVLKRNQACHQCRRRKLKCDAKRPCSTCVRSHAHAVSHAPAGTQLPTHPECTFDDIPESSTSTTEVPRNRYEKLENRISELEALLSQKEHGSGQTDQTIHSQSSFFTQPISHFTSPSLSLTNLIPGSISQPPISNNIINFDQFPTIPDFSSASFLDSNASMGDSPSGAFITSTPSPPATKAGSFDVHWPHWPPNLPPPELLRHLVEVFLSFQPNATRLLHASSFLASLSLPPTHPKFPIAPLLHSICAVGSLYTAAVSSAPLPNFERVASDELFLEKHRLKERRSDSFAEQQARYAKETIEQFQTMGESLLPCVQAHIILSWYYWCQSKWVEVYIASAHTLRLVVPLGLSVCPPFHSIAKTIRAPSLLAPARTCIEDETRRNVFWLAYAMERLHGAGNAWAMSLDDHDVSQLLPVRGDQFEQGILVNPQDRQWACSKDLLLIHPEEQTDPFILYIKGTILMSRVKNFNLRFRSRFYAGDPTVTSFVLFPTPCEPSLTTDPVDPRCTPAFRELDDLVAAFRGSFPSHLKDPIVNNVVDSHLYTTCLVPHVATILLHEPHADVRQSGCVSALRILTASRSILDLVYLVWSTSYDITLLDLFCTFCWFMSGRILVRFLQAAVEVQSQEQISTLRAEVEFIRLAISKVGERIPLAYRYAKMLDDVIAKSHGTVPLIPISEIPSIPKNTDLVPQSSSDQNVSFFFENTPDSSDGFFSTSLESVPQSQPQIV